MTPGLGQLLCCLFHHVDQSKKYQQKTTWSCLIETHMPACKKKYMYVEKSTWTFNVWDLLVQHDVKGRPRSRVSKFVVDILCLTVRRQNHNSRSFSSVYSENNRRMRHSHGVVFLTGILLVWCSRTSSCDTPPGPMPEWNTSIAINATDLISACPSRPGPPVTELDESLQGFSIMELPNDDATTIARVAVKYFADVPSIPQDNDTPSPSMEGGASTVQDDGVSTNAIAAPVKAEILACAPNIEQAMKSVDVTEACRKETNDSVEYIVEMNVVFTCTSSIATVPGQTYSVTMVSLVSIPPTSPLTVQKVFIAN